MGLGLGFAQIGSGGSGSTILNFYADNKYIKLEKWQAAPAGTRRGRWISGVFGPSRKGLKSGPN